MSMKNFIFFVFILASLCVWSKSSSQAPSSAQAHEVDFCGWLKGGNPGFSLSRNGISVFDALIFLPKNYFLIPSQAGPVQFSEIAPAGEVGFLGQVEVGTLSEIHHSSTIVGEFINEVEGLSASGPTVYVIGDLGLGAGIGLELFVMNGWYVSYTGLARNVLSSMVRSAVLPSRDEGFNPLTGHCLIDNEERLRGRN